MENCESVGPEVAWGSWIQESLNWKSGIQFNYPIIRQFMKLYKKINTNKVKNDKQEKQTNNMELANNNSLLLSLDKIEALPVVILLWIGTILLG